MKGQKRIPDTHKFKVCVIFIIIFLICYANTYPATNQINFDKLRHLNDAPFHYIKRKLNPNEIEEMKFNLSDRCCVEYEGNPNVEGFKSLGLDTDAKKRERNRKNPILMPDTDGHIWRDAFEKNFSEQTLINNVVKEVANSLVRNIGWLTLEYILYGGENIATK